MGFELAQVNYSRLNAELDSPQLRAFVDALDPVNVAADIAPGFVWRLQSDDGDATSIPAFEWDAGDSVGVIVNMSVWTDMDHLAAFVYGDMHRQIMRQRRQFFEHMLEATAACWWVPAGHRPSVAEAEERILRLRTEGATPAAFTMQRHFPPPDAPGATREQAGADDWLCPA